MSKLLVINEILYHTAILRFQKVLEFSLDGLESAVSSHSRVWGGAPENLDFGAFWDLGQKSRQNSQLAFESGEGE